eukprot:TRINITY_DN86863_c0_g1_i1.p1 TRINITY_DN86863_c0_g1~~TRINITY_DN86863_c0_g1_i1.p1  ORF type:complete len:557 (+),score=161.29 TRINITY_DN86863_c0_g1_i1:26-1696(+)
MTTTRSFAEYQKDKREREWKEKVQSKKESMGNAERVKTSTEYKRIGNDKFKSGNFHEARDYYREAIIYVEDLVDARRKERNELLVPLYANLAQVYLRLEGYGEAEDVCSKALAIAEIPRNEVPTSLKAKSHFRRGVARRFLEKAEESRDDLQAVLKLQPEHEEVQKELAVVRAQLAEKSKQAKAAWGGFLQKEAARRETREEKERREEEKRRKAEERRKERLARAQERQQMQGAFEKLSKGEMLYEAREKEMEPVRQKELEKKQTIELEQNLMNIIDESKGKPKVEKYDDYVKAREDRAWDQSAELDQKKKVLDKIKKEEQWQEDDVWRDQRDEHRKQIKARPHQPQPKSMWEAVQVDRWCQQRIRDLMVPCMVQAEGHLEPELAAVMEGLEGPCVLRALITDVLKLNGDASVVRLNKHKPPLHYFDYFIKLDWEVHVAMEHESSYRTGEELITAAAATDDAKAPPSVAKNRVIGGTFKIREFSSEEIPEDGKWPFLTKLKRRYKGPYEGSKFIERLEKKSEALRDRLLEHVQTLLCRWVEEYREHWAIGTDLSGD